MFVKESAIRPTDGWDEAPPNPPLRGVSHEDPIGRLGVPASL